MAKQYARKKGFQVFRNLDVANNPTNDEARGPFEFIDTAKCKASFDGPIDAKHIKELGEVYETRSEFEAAAAEKNLLVKQYEG